MIEILAGVISGIVSALGMGGGTILILILSLFLGMEQHSAQATNIIFFIPAALVAIFMNTKSKKIKWNIGIPIVIAGIVGAVVGASVSIRLDTNTLKKCFGIFLAIVAVHEIYSLFKKYKISKKWDNRYITKFYKEEIMNMKFVKGMVVGTLVSTGVIMMCMDAGGSQKLLKKVEKWLKD